MKEEIIETTEQLAAALKRITFVNTAIDFDWKFEYQVNQGRMEGWFVWVLFQRPDTHTGVVGLGQGRKELIQHGATLSSVVKTAWLLVELVVRHELMEGFRFDDQRIFNPHTSVEDLAALQRWLTSDAIDGGNSVISRGAVSRGQAQHLNGHYEAIDNITRKVVDIDVKTKARPICTRLTPAPNAEPWVAGCNHSNNWNRDWDHPDVEESCVNDDHGDYRFYCPHCQQARIEEGSDS